MAYNPELPNKYDRGLIPEEVRDEYFEEYFNATPISSFMGEQPSNSIQIFDIAKGGGKTVHVSLRRELDYKQFISGYAKISGTEQRPTFYEDIITIALNRLAVGVDSTKWTAQLTPIDVYDSMKPLLLNASKKDLVMKVLATACKSYNPAAEIPSYDRAVFAGLEPDRGHWYANIDAGIAAMAGGTAHNENGLSVDMIRNLKSFAVNGGASDIVDPEAAITPIQVLKDIRSFPEEYYVLLADTKGLLSLYNDPQWSQFAYRGVIENKDQPSFIKGGRYRGMVEGVFVFECKELNAFRRISGGRTMSWNLLMGAQAFAVAWGYDRTWFKMQEQDYGSDIGMAICEMRGEKMLQFPSFINENNKVERGLIHAFTRIA